MLIAQKRCVGIKTQKRHYASNVHRLQISFYIESFRSRLKLVKYNQYSHNLVSSIIPEQFN